MARPSTDLRGSFGERVLLPADAGYDLARRVRYGVERRPAAVVMARDVDDVSKAIMLARERGLELAVRGGGHSPAGHGGTEGGIVLDLGRMNRVDVDVDGRAAWAGAGATAGRYTAVAGVHGLATGFGDTASVGIAGLTLSGGIGLLVRKHGMTIDNLLAADIVTADGELHRADARTNPDLFWALRGGGGNFGVVTRLQYRLHEVGTVVGGRLMLPATPETVAAFLDAAHAAPEELSTIANIIPMAPGRLVISATLVFAGGIEAGRAAMAPFRGITEPLDDTVGPIDYPHLFAPIPDSYHVTAATRTVFGTASDTAAVVCARLGDPTASTRIVQLRVLGGAMARVPSDATAFAHRGARLMATVVAFYAGTAERRESRAWVDEVAAASSGSAAAPAGFVGEEGLAADVYPGATLQRLAAIKRRYDPTNLLRRNLNVAPAKEGVAV